MDINPDYSLELTFLSSIRLYLRVALIGVEGLLRRWLPGSLSTICREKSFSHSTPIAGVWQEILREISQLCVQKPISGQRSA